MSHLDPHSELQSYLDELLGASDSVDKPQSSSKTGVKPPVNTQINAQVNTEPTQSLAPSYIDSAEKKREQLQKLLHSARIQVEQVVDTAPAPSAETSAPEADIAEPATTELTPAAISQAVDVLQEQLQWHENGRPQWAQNTFEVLLFTVSGLTLAVPLISLGQIQPITDELTPLFGQADWFMGLQPTAEGKIRTVNTAKFVMPERYDDNFVKTAKYVVSINGVPWGLAVDSVEQPVSVQPEDVKWRSARTQRPWLAGTVKDKMCALLDIPMMGKMLLDSDRNSARSS